MTTDDAFLTSYTDDVSSYPAPTAYQAVDPSVFDGFSDAEIAGLVYTALSLSLLSAIASVFIIVTFFKFPRLHTFAYKVIMMLAVANLCLDGAYLVGNAGHDNWRCTAQGFARVYFALVEFALVTAITLTCYVMIVKHEFTIRERFWKVMAYCWLIPLVMACLPFTTSNYGDAGSWCSITARDLKSLEWGTFWRFGVIYIPLWLCVGVNAYMCFKVYRAMRGFEATMVAYAEPLPGTGEAGEVEVVVSGRGEGGGGESGSGRAVESSTSMPIINRLRLYPIALVVCWSWATVNRVLEAINPYVDSVYWLYVLQYTFQTIQGVLNLIIFLRTPSVREEWRDQIAKWRAARQRVRSVDHAALLTSSVSSGESPQ